MCKRCGGTLYTEQDQYGTHQTCLRCGATRMVMDSSIDWMTYELLRHPGWRTGRVPKYIYREEGR